MTTATDTTLAGFLERQRLDPLLTLGQLAEMVGRSKRTLEHVVNDPAAGMPAPEVEGGGGRPALWRWSRVRGWLAARYRRHDLPERFRDER